MLNCSCSRVTQHSVPRSAHTHLRTHIAGRTSRARSQYRRPIDCLPLLLAGTATSTKRRGESVSQKASVGMLTKADSLSGCESVRGSVMISSRGSWKAFSIWFVKVPVAHTREFACSCYVQNTGMHHTSMSSLSLNTMAKYLWNTGRVAAGHVVCTGVLPELEHSALAVGASRDDAHWQHKRRHTRVQKQRASSVLLRFPASRLIRRNIGREKRVEGMAAGMKPRGQHAVCTRDCHDSREMGKGDKSGAHYWYRQRGSRSPR